jgi:hypothetical protein
VNRQGHVCLINKILYVCIMYVKALDILDIRRPTECTAALTQCLIHADFELGYSLEA